jgi:thiamine-monophosphate kinase
VPLSRAFIAERGQGRAARLFAATGGDDYALLAALPAEVEPSVTLSLPNKPTLVCIGKLVAGSAVALTHGGKAVPLPEPLGYEHRTEHPPMGDRL